MPRKVTTPKDSPPPVTVPTCNVKAGRPAESTVSKPSTIEGSNTTGNTDLGRKATQAQTSQYDRTRGVPEEVGKKHPAPRPIQADLPGGRQHAPNGRMTATPRAPQFTSPALEDVDSP
ncbi:hypothetical protein A0H81_09526 [Grifola frondosa]|uniref:Uncharacterized protein n=1 Tax=Grifola frondosa TaxID=5627 RepID=A0A1C7M1C4_GRIFR|nr:hypothetical protein A0H81_09526 [Grifola frondosa]